MTRDKVGETLLHNLAVINAMQRNAQQKDDLSELATIAAPAPASDGNDNDSAVANEGASVPQIGSTEMSSDSAAADALFL